MKLKYYLRGAAVGIIFTTLLLSIVYRVDASKQEEEFTKTSVQEAGTEIEEQSGNRTIQEALEKKDESSDREEDTAEEVVQNNRAQEERKVENVEQLAFVITAGETPTTISSRLAEAGIIDDADSYLQYLKEVNKANDLEIGTFYLVPGSDYETITTILTTYQEK